MFHLFTQLLRLSQNPASLQICFKEVRGFFVVVILFFVLFLSGTCPLENEPGVRCFSVTFGILSTLKFSNSQMWC